MTQLKRQIKTIFFAMGTVCSITVYGEADRAAIAPAKQMVMELHRRLNAYDPQSEISQINQNAGVRFTEVSADTRSIIERCISYSKMTNGLFDVTTTPISQLWKDCIRARVLPLDYERQRAAALVNWRDIRIDGNSIMLKNKGQRIDLGAVAKGYAADEVRRILTEHEVENALINFGGTVVVIGDEQFVGIQNPFEKTGTSFASIPVSDQAVVSSGLYEQGFVQGGRTYHHIINPKTGFPSDSGLAGITLIGEDAEELDALSTTAFMLPITEAYELLNNGRIEAVFIAKDGKVFITDRLQNDFRMIQKGA